MWSDGEMEGVEHRPDGRIEIAKITVKRGAQRGDGGDLGDPGLGPAVDEPPERSIGRVEVDVFAASGGHGSGKFGIGERAEQGQDSAENPDEENHGWRTDSLHHVRGDQEDSAADGGPDHHGDGRPGSQGPAEFRIVHADGSSLKMREQARPVAKVAELPISTYHVHEMGVANLIYSINTRPTHMAIIAAVSPTRRVNRPRRN